MKEIEFLIGKTAMSIYLKQAYFSIRRIRLVVKTKGSQPWKKGSNALCAKKINLKYEELVEVEFARFH